MNKYIVFAGVGFELVGLIVASVYLGEYLEGKTPSKGLWVAGLILVSLVGWLVHVVAMLKNIQKQKVESSDKT